MSSSSFLIWSWGTALLSAACLQAGRFLSIPKQGEMFGKPLALRAMACTTPRLCCPGQGTRSACSAVHPSADPHPVSHSCTWAGWQQERQVLGSVESMPLSKYWLPRSIWEIIQLKNNTDVLSGNLTDYFRQLTSLHSFLLWPPLEMQSYLSPSFNCWWEPPTENNPLHFDRNIHQSVLHTQFICQSS